MREPHGDGSSTVLRVARATLLVAGVCGATALAANYATHSRAPFALLVVGGGALVARGLMVLTNYRGALDTLAEREQSRWWARVGPPHETRAGAAAAVYIGAVWMLIGVTSLVGLFD